MNFGREYTSLISELSLIFVLVFVCGFLLALGMFHFKLRKLLASKLGTKILMWLPLFAGLVIFLAMDRWLRLVFVIAILATGLRDMKRRLGKRHAKLIVAFYILFIVAFFHLALISFVFSFRQSLVLVSAICYGSVISDVCAFFGGKFFGKHTLPKYINNSKSWEGVGGQVIGAYIGLGLFSTFTGFAVLSLALPIGLGSALGDIGNSYVKRKAGIDEWSGSIAGHGGIAYRFSSLAVAAVICFYLALIFKSAFLPF